jgi:lipopolysaccharide export LptBFGC system permease protein LptF
MPNNFCVLLWRSSLITVPELLGALLLSVLIGVSIQYLIPVSQLQRLDYRFIIIYDAQ